MQVGGYDGSAPVSYFMRHDGVSDTNSNMPVNYPIALWVQWLACMSPIIDSLLLR